MKRELILLQLAMASLVIAGGLVALGFALSPAGALPAQSLHLSPGPDLVIESITIEPPVPDPGQACTITVVIRNRGNAKSGGFSTYLYIDPPDQPPTPTTPDTSWTSWFGLNPGERFSWQYSGYEFTTVSCDHVVYAWVDRDNLVPEDDETNNLSSVQVCVGTTPTPTPTSTATPTPTPTPCVPDDYEPDDTCDAAQEITTDGTHQGRNLCPVGDQDWVEFTARAGITYTIETTGVGVDGDTVLTLYGDCGEPPIASDDPDAGTVARIVWYCTTSGVYSVKVNHHSADYGPAASYDLSITPSTNCPEDIYEDDNNCIAARDIPTDGTTQTHIFCAAGDHDWVKFNATSGSTIIVRTQNLGAGATPMLSIFDACNVPLSTGHPQQLEWISATDETYYIKLENHDSEVYGPTTNYDLSVATLGCDGDEYEFDGGDDKASQARLIRANDPDRTHNFCPAGDEDWVKFDAVAGKNYVIETFNLGLDSDTYLCLYEADGTTEITCDDDGTGMKAARIIWTCPSSGTYYVQVHHYNPTASGPNTAYNLSVTIGLRIDGYEPDDGHKQASPITSDGKVQTHNFTPENDDDWVKFNAVAGDYAIQTINLEPGCDTVLQLYNTDGATLLAENDDFSFGLGSQITYTIPSAGTYYALIHNYRPSRFGTNMQYELRVVQGTPPPVPTPTPIPTPTPPAMPPPSAVKTLILVNREGIRSLYGPEQTTQLMNKLYALASHPRVLGNIVQVETDAAVAAAYDEWIADPLSTVKANDVANAVRNQVLAYLDKNPNVEYIVIVGNDEVIPFRRTLDRTSHPESHYQIYVSSHTTIWAACGDDMTLTDSYYADREPTDFAGHELYIPDYAIGRLVETPEEIMDLIDIFLAGSTMSADKALVTGYDFIKDVADEVCNTLGTDLGSAKVDCELRGETWNGSQLRAKQLDTVPRFDIQSINGHANASTEGAPQTPNVRASDIATWGSADLNRALIYTLGCHSGLNDVGVLPGGLDLAQSLSQRGANYVANTGYGWGLGNAIGLSERLMYNFTQELLKGGSAIIGQALTAAKKRYYAETPTFGDYDEKVLIESTLYGLPMYEIQTGAALEGEIFPSVVVTSGAPLPLNGLGEGHLELGLAQSFASLGETHTADGTFFDLDGHIHLGAGEPIQPKFFADVSMPDAGRAHGVIFTGGTYTDTAAFDPVVVQPINEDVTSTVEPAFEAPGWYPPVPFALHNSATISGTETLVTAMGQYNSVGRVERIYDRMSFDVYYSDSYDWWEPIILSVDGVLDFRSLTDFGSLGGVGRIKVEAIDASDVHGVVAVYTDGSGTQVSQDLSYNSETLKWTGEIPATKETKFYVQVVDGAGNVATADNKGIWYTLEAVEAGPRVVYLPLVLKGF